MLDALPAELLVRAHKLDSVAQISAHAPSGDRRCKTRHLVATHTNLASGQKPTSKPTKDNTYTSIAVMKD